MEFVFRDGVLDAAALTDKPVSVVCAFNDLRLFTQGTTRFADLIEDRSPRDVSVSGAIEGLEARETAAAFSELDAEAVNVGVPVVNELVRSRLLSLSDVASFEMYSFNLDAPPRIDLFFERAALAWSQKLKGLS